MEIDCQSAGGMQNIAMVVGIKYMKLKKVMCSQFNAQHSVIHLV